MSAQGKRTDELIEQVEERNKISRENQIINEKDNFLIDRATLSYNKREIDSFFCLQLENKNLHLNYQFY